MEVTSWLIDKSAYVRLRTSPDVSAWQERIIEGRVRVSTITLLELGYSARSAGDIKFERLYPPLSLLQIEYLTTEH